MWRITTALLLSGLLAACASQRQVKVNCSSHLVRINAPPATPVPVAQPSPARAAMPADALATEETSSTMDDKDESP